jgi:hypothetical protein
MVNSEKMHARGKENIYQRKGRTMDDNFTFWYPVVIEVQLSLDGKEFSSEVLKTGHILYQGRPMCGESMEVLKNRTKKTYEAQTIKDKTVKLRVPHIRICSECQEEYRGNKNSALYAWIEGKPKPASGIERPVKI